MFYGKIDNKKQIDHINGKKLDNRIKNLRLVSGSENGRNQKLSKDNTTGRTGVYYAKDRNKYLATIRNKGKSVYLGYYKSFNEAVRARERGEKRYKYHPNHGRVT